MPTGFLRTAPNAHYPLLVGLDAISKATLVPVLLLMVRPARDAPLTHSDLSLSPLAVLLRADSRSPVSWGQSCRTGAAP